MENEFSLKNIKINQNLSRETLYFSATLLYKGIPVFYVENDGKGSMNKYIPIGKADATLLKSLNKRAKKLTGEDFEPLDLLILQLLLK